MTEIPDAETMRAFNESIVDEFRAHNGKVGGPFEGKSLLLLTSTGARSGEPRLAPLAYLRIHGKMIIIGSKGGADTNPDWVHNLRANPRAHIEVGTDAYDVTARSNQARMARNGRVGGVAGTAIVVTVVVETVVGSRVAASLRRSS